MPVDPFARLDIGDCWNWTGYVTPYGYGQLTVQQQRHQAHRWFYEQLVGLVPDGFDLDHLCRNRRCCNPDHLEVVTRQENLRRGVHPNSLKLHCPRGHDYTTLSNGRRYCNVCRKERHAARCV